MLQASAFHYLADVCQQRLSGASLLVFKNKSDVAGAMTEDEIREVCSGCTVVSVVVMPMLTDCRDCSSRPSRHTSGTS